MRVLVATDAWRPQINGVVRSLEYLASEAPSLGAEIMLLTPADFRTVPLPGYREIRLALPSIRRHRARNRRGTIRTRCISRPRARSAGSPGMSARRAAIRSRPAITPGFRNISRRGCRFRCGWSYAALRRFHNGGRWHHGRLAIARTSTEGAWLPQADAVVARRRCRAVLAPAQSRR